MRAFSGVRAALACLILSTVACGGEDDSGPPPQKTLTPKKPGTGGASGGGGASAGGSSTGGNGNGNNGGVGNTGGSNTGGSNTGGSSAGGNSAGGSAQGGNNAGGSSAGGASGSSTGGSSTGGNAQGGNGAGGGNGGAGGVIENKCTSKVDCDQYPDRPFCNTEISLCVACLEDAHCTKDPDAKVCDVSIGQCVECLKEADCAAHPNGPHCDLGTSRCTCQNNGECASSTKGKLCDVDGLRRCAECITAFDCKDPKKPGCSLDDVCFKGDFCSGDDPEETGDDGPLGAMDITPPVLDFPELPPWKRTVENRHVCDLPVEESDWYKFKVEDRDAYELSVSWGDTQADLDLIVTDSTGRLYGYNYFSRPAKVLLTYMPAGTYYAFVYRSAEFDKVSQTPTTYTVNVSRLPEAGKCFTTADCAANFDFQFYRGVCDGVGVCRFIEGNGKLGKGAKCDDDKDCESGLCSYQPFTRNAHQRSFCTTFCGNGEPCPSDQRCATYLTPEVCLDTCSSDDECHASLSSIPPQGKNWYYMTCNKDTGDCE